MADQKPVVTFKDGTKLVLDDASQLGQYSNRDDIDSISFFGDDGIPDAGIIEQMDAGVQQTVATVEQPKADPVVPKPQPAPDHAAAVTATIGAVAGAVSSAGAPAVMNLAKSFIKGKLKLGKLGNLGNSNGPSQESRPEDEKEEPTDCKTHQIKAGVKFASLSARLAALESRPTMVGNDNSNVIERDDDYLEELEERIKKLEKLIKEGKKNENIKKPTKNNNQRRTRKSS